jgi:hypothetical protein
VNKSYSVLVLTGLWAAAIVAACTGGDGEAPTAADPVAVDRYIARLAAASAEPAKPPAPEPQQDAEGPGIKLSKDTVNRIDRSEPMIGAVLTVAR